MPQFFLPPGARQGESFRLTGPEAFHISKVLRYQKGQDLELFDGRGGRYHGRITGVDPEGAVEGVVTATLSSPHSGSKVSLRLYQSLLKSTRWEWLLEKGTEIGLQTFIPVSTSRTVVLLRDAERKRAKADRWQKIVLAAAKQCGRSDLPEIRPPMAFRDALKEAEADGLTFLAWENMSGPLEGPIFKQALASNEKTDVAARGRDGDLQINLFVGPEGGFTDEEVELAQFHKANIFSLGANTLRGETAAIVASSLILYGLRSVL